MSSYQYRKSHCGDKTILRPSYLHNGISYTGKMTSLYWIGAQENMAKKVKLCSREYVGWWHRKAIGVIPSAGAVNTRNYAPLHLRAGVCKLENYISNSLVFTLQCSELREVVKFIKCLCNLSSGCLCITFVQYMGLYGISWPISLSTIART